MIKLFKVARHERAFLFRSRDFVRVLKPGWHFYVDPLFRIRIDVEDVSRPLIESERLDVIVKSGALGDEAVVAELADGKRALVFVDGRLERVLVPGLYAFWKVLKDVRVEILDATRVRVETPALAKLIAIPGTAALIEIVDVEAGAVGLYFLNGVLREALSPGRYAFWKGEGRVEVRRIDLREQVLDVGGQEIMTADKVTLRLNAVLTYRVEDAEKALAFTADYAQLVYREVQLALRAVVGTRTLDAILNGKDRVSAELESMLRSPLAAVGLALGAIGVRDVILPGDMKELLNKVTEAAKAAEANLITRREEVAALRSQLNAARLIESSPTLMRLRELEVLEKVADKAKLSIVLGDGGLTEKVVKLL